MVETPPWKPARGLELKGAFSGCEPMLNSACSTGAEVEGLQDATSENGVERAKVSQREPHRGGVEPGEYHLRSVSDFLHAVLSVAVAASREDSQSSRTDFLDRRVPEANWFACGAMS